MPPARLNRRNRPAPPPPPPAVEEGAEPATIVMPDPEAETAHVYRKNPLPKDKIAIKCEDCGGERTKYVDDASIVDEVTRKEMFDKNGSYKPPLCGFCLRSRKRKKSAERAAA